MRKAWSILALLVLLLSLGGLGFLMGGNWGQGAAWASGIYGVLITIFLGLQVYGFVVEHAKFELLEREGIAFDEEDTGGA